MKTILLSTTLAMLFCQFSTAQTPGEAAMQKLLKRNCPVITLWPAGQVPIHQDAKPDNEKKQDAESLPESLDPRPDKTRVTDVTQPSMTIVAPPAEAPQTGAAILLCPGGGYRHQVMDRPVELANLLNEKGITAVILKYRTPFMRHAAFQDAQRALSLLRSRADEWGLAKDKIGIGGFSAGGHLSAMLSNNHEERAYEPIDEHDQVSCRPDFAWLAYAAYLTEPKKSREDAEELRLSELTPTRTPPTFLSVAINDSYSIGNIQYVQRLAAAEVPVELHGYPSGGHGVGTKNYPYNESNDEALRFLADIGILEQKSTPTPQPELAELVELKKNNELTPADQQIQAMLGGECETLQLWPEGTRTEDPSTEIEEGIVAKDFIRIKNVSAPSITIRQPKQGNPTGRAVIICPGGAYNFLAAEHEGTMVVDWLNELGITAVLLKYRCPRRKSLDKHIVAFQDGQRAIRMVRANAEKWKLDPNNIGVLGFSAGGHLTALLATNSQTQSYEPIDEVDKLSAFVNFSLPIYPAYLDVPEKPHVLEPLVQNGLNEDTSPMFIAIAANDRFLTGTLNLAVAAQKANVPTELHIFRSGGHGGGMDRSRHPFAQWIPAATRWLQDLEKAAAKKQKKDSPSK